MGEAGRAHKRSLRTVVINILRAHRPHKRVRHDTVAARWLKEITAVVASRIRSKCSHPRGWCTSRWEFAAHGVGGIARCWTTVRRVVSLRHVAQWNTAGKLRRRLGSCPRRPNGVVLDWAISSWGLRGRAWRRRPSHHTPGPRRWLRFASGAPWGRTRRRL
jgi:hypothetical protein